MGVPLYADECTTKQLRISFTRILSEIDVTKDILYHVNFEDSNGTLIKQKATYDWLLSFCKVCQKVGHDSGNKRRQVIQQQQKPMVIQKWIPKVPQVTVTDPETNLAITSDPEVPSNS